MIVINFMSFKDIDEERLMHLESDNKEINNGKVDEATEKLFQSLLSRYQINLETTMKGISIFDHVHLLYYKCHKVNPDFSDHIWILGIG